MYVRSFFSSGTRTQFSGVFSRDLRLLLDFFLTKIPHGGALASSTRYLSAPLSEILKISKYLDVRPLQKKFRNFAPVSLPKVKKAEFNIELRKQGSHRTIRRGFKV